ncbi:MAG: hypothetical protein V7750_08035, partial [Sneathiella sp.]
MHWFLQRVLIGASHKQTIAKYSTGFDQSLGVLTVSSAATLGVGVAAPFATLEAFYGLSGEYSIFSAVMELLGSGEGGLALGIAALIIALPVYGVSTAFDLWYKHELQNEKFEKVSGRSSLCGYLWFISFAAAAALIFEIQTTSSDVILHQSVYSLLLSLVLQKIVLTRISRLISMVQFTSR